MGGLLHILIGGLAMGLSCAAHAENGLSRELKEDFRVVDERSLSAERFQAEMTRLAKRLYPQHDFVKDPVHFVILDEKVVNATYFKGRKAIGFTTELLRRARTLDRLAYVLSHEWRHKELEAKLGPGKNSKGEEFLADLDLEVLHEAGFDAKEALEFAKTLATEKVPGWERFLDAHGLSKNRQEAIEKKLAILDREQGGLKYSPTAIPAIFREIADGAKHVSYLQSARAQTEYAGQTTVRKLEIIKSWVNELEPGREQRAKELAVMIRELSITTPQEKALLHDVANELLPLLKTDDSALWVQGERVYRALSDKLGTGGLGRPVLGDLRNIERAIRDFMASNSTEEAVVNARKLKSVLERDELSPRFLIGLDLPHFALTDVDELEKRLRKRKRDPSVKLPKVDWNSLVQFSAEDPSGVIAESLLRLGVRDNRLLEGQSVYQRILLREAARHPIVKVGGNENSDRIENFRIGSKGSYLEHSAREDLSPFAPVTEADLEELYLEILQGKFRAENRAVALKGLLDKSKGIHYVGLNHLEENPELFFEFNQGAGITYTSDGEATSNDPEEHLIVKKLKDFIAKDPTTNGPRIREAMKSFMSMRPYFSPIFRFVLDPDSKLFESVEDAQRFYLERAEGVGPTLEADFLVHTQRFLKIKPATTAKQVHAAFERIKKLGGVNPNPGLVDNILDAVLQDFRRNRNPKDTDAIDFPWLASHFNEVPSNLIPWFQQEITAYQWSEDAATLIGQWESTKTAKLFPAGSDLSRTLIARILDKVAVAPPADRHRLLTSLFGSGRIEFPALRDRAFDLYAESLKEVHQLDTGTKAYQNKVMKPIAEATKVLAAADRIDLLERIARRLQAQRTLSKALKESYGTLDRKTLESSHLIGVLSEGGLEQLRKKKEIRKELIDFLTRPLTDDSAHRAKETFAEIDSYAAVAVKDRSQEGLDRHYVYEARKMHENFWAAPFSVRALILDQLLLTPDEKAQSGHKEAIEFILPRLFPSNEMYAEQARKILRNYIEVIPHYQRSLLLSAMMVASQRSEGTNSIGERLALLLELMGPAETKLGQAIHSFPDTPEEIRLGMGRLKAQADLPFRWDLFDLFDERVPESFRKKVKRVRNVLGAASYFIVFEIEMKDGRSAVVALLRPHALERAENGFQHIEALAERLGTTDPLVNNLMVLTRQARSMAVIETSAEKNKQQHDIAKENYRGMKVKVGDREFYFHAIGFLDPDSWGEGYRVMEKAPGAHFNDLPTQTPEQMALKKDFAKAYIALELHLLLKGGKFDHDRHGAQLKIDGTDAYLFDYGAMSLVDPTPEERKLLGELIFDSMHDLKHGGSLGEILFKKVQAMSRNGKQPPQYLVEVQKGLLAMGDFFQVLTRNEVGDILLSVIEKGDIHPEITGGFLGRMAATGEFDFGTQDPNLCDAAYARTAITITRQ